MEGGKGGEEGKGEERHGACCPDVAGESREEGLPKFAMAICLAVFSLPWLASVAIMRAFRDDTY